MSSGVESGIQPGPLGMGRKVYGPLSETPHQIIERLRREGRTSEAGTFRRKFEAHCKRNGEVDIALIRSRAWAAVVEEYPPLSLVPDEELPITDFDVGKVDLVRDILWAFYHLGIRATKRAHAPSSMAWETLNWARGGKRKDKFFTIHVTKVLAIMEQRERRATLAAEQVARREVVADATAALRLRKQVEKVGLEGDFDVEAVLKSRTGEADE